MFFESIETAYERGQVRVKCSVEDLIYYSKNLFILLRLLSDLPLKFPSDSIFWNEMDQGVCVTERSRQALILYPIDLKECTPDELIKNWTRLHIAVCDLSRTLVKRNIWTKGDLDDRNLVERGVFELGELRKIFGAQDVNQDYIRYGRDALFTDTPEVKTKSGWLVCPKCRCSVCSYGFRDIGLTCRDVVIGTCDGIMRELVWDDIKPEFYPPK